MNEYIFLIGFMGTGKSSIAKELGKLMNMEVVDIDDVIAEREGMSISEIFKNSGEEYFRKLEAEALRRIPEYENCVIACGGGLPLKEANRKLMREIGKVILLTGTPYTIFERIKDNNDRPLLSGKTDIAYIQEMMGKRDSDYREAAHIVINIDNKNITQICNELLPKLI